MGQNKIYSKIGMAEYYGLAILPKEEHVSNLKTPEIVPISEEALAEIAARRLDDGSPGSMFVNSPDMTVTWFHSTYFGISSSLLRGQIQWRQNVPDGVWGEWLPAWVGVTGEILTGGFNFPPELPKEQAHYVFEFRYPESTDIHYCWVFRA